MTKFLTSTAAIALAFAATSADAKPLPQCKITAVTMSPNIAGLAAGVATASGAKPEGSSAVVTASGAKPEGSGAVVTASGAKPEGSGAVVTASGAKPEGSGAVVTASGAKPEGSGAVVTASAAKSGDNAAYITFKIDTSVPCEIRIPIKPGKF